MQLKYGFKYECIKFFAKFFGRLSIWFEKIAYMFGEISDKIWDKNYISDGYNTYFKYCINCGAKNVIVRIGDCRCSKECYLKNEEK